MPPYSDFPHRPTTPDNSNPSKGPESQLQSLQSTPSNRGSASVAEHLASARVDDVRSAIFADIEKHDTCTVDSLLKGMLSLLPKEEIPHGSTDLLNKCLEAVLPICNGHSKLRSNLEAYRRGSDEPARYGPFVRAFNHALEALRAIDVPPLQRLNKTAEDEILFHRNDPMLIQAKHNGHGSDRKPDVILVSLKAARKASSKDDQGSWGDYAFETAAEAPKNNFEWKVSFSAVEFKKKSKKLPPLLKKYSVGSAKTILPHPNPRRETEDLATWHEGTQSSRDGMPKSSKNGEPSQSDRRTSQSAYRSSHPSSSSKRKSDHEEESSSKKRKTEAELSRSLRRSPMVQSALYAAERMSHGIWISHAINLVVVDHEAFVWWYDNKGAIQSYGIDFINDLPHFLVLLLCFERFTPEDWGVVSRFHFSPQEAGDHCQLTFPSGPEIDITLDNKIHGHYGIKGRATQVLGATSVSIDPRNEKKSLEGQELVVKVYWPEATRAGEAEIITKAVEIAGGSDDVKGHLPDLIFSHDFGQYSTNVIRKAFGIETEGHRVLRIILFRRLYPITDLTEDKFWNAFWDCFRCHHRLWLGGVQHNDISVKNLMYDKLNGDCGVLNDYDLAHLHGRLRPSGFERTGTMPFMALDLLTDEAMKGQIERLYRHDCESFAWVLLWICCRYDDGKEISNAPLSELNTHNYKQCFDKKLAIQFENLSPTASYERFWFAAIELLHWPISRRSDRRWSRARDKREPKIDEVVNKCREALETAGFDVVL
ncbi:hypothetical protein DFH94DRAFT_338639 [Russula ochroleuca]|uniref:Fungal-type protein kinase domain-containing protein n=1 Tax=Russula ochroleuca TaxID=152965 RepID=A0A9P5TC61_9AGAM|nr:hypothetical protein DFH94DRAFT_338639 [Russula ochroleuca]